MLRKDRSSYAIQLVENTLCVLEAISEEPGEFGVSYLSAKLGMKRSFIFRVLATFEKQGYVYRDGASGYYRIGLSAYQTGGRFLHQMKLLQKAKPIMAALAKESEETIYLAVPGGKDLLFLEMVDSTQQVRVMSFLGKRFSLEDFSAGKVITAYNANSNELDCSPESILSKDVYSDYNTVGVGVVSLSVPILDDQRFACASLCMLAPEFRISHDLIEKSLLPLLINAGEELSAKLGYIETGLLKRCG